MRQVSPADDLSLLGLMAAPVPAGDRNLHDRMDAPVPAGDQSLHAGMIVPDPEDDRNHRGTMDAPDLEEVPDHRVETAVPVPVRGPSLHITRGAPDPARDPSHRVMMAVPLLADVLNLHAGTGVPVQRVMTDRSEPEFPLVSDQPKDLFGMFREVLYVPGAVNAVSSPCPFLAGMNRRTVSRWGRGFHFRIAVLKIPANSFSPFSMQQKA